MNYKTQKDSLFFLFEGHLQGYIEADYKELKKLFGIPTKGDGYKTDAEWYIYFDDNSHCYVYNWKNGKNYLGSEGTPKALIKNWHIGSTNKRSFRHLEKLLKTKIKHH